jgi:hypothetical protein
LRSWDERSVAQVNICPAVNPNVVRILAFSIRSLVAALLGMTAAAGMPQRFRRGKVYPRPHIGDNLDSTGYANGFSAHDISKAFGRG